ncbi:hypothetical protein N9A45_02075 [bacterium]|nr:hypothetical protein [bacterium]
MFKSYTKGPPNIDSEFEERVLVAYSLLSDEMKQRPAHHVATHLAEHFLAAEPKKKGRAKVPTRGRKPLALLILGILATIGDVANGTLHQIASAPETAGDAYMKVIQDAQLVLQGGDDNGGDEINDLVKEVLDEEETDDEDLTEDEEQQEEKHDTDKGKLVEFKEKMNQNQGWFSFMDPNDDSRLQTNAAYAEKVINHASNVMEGMSASDARKLQKFAKPIRELISKDLLKQMLSHDRNFVRTSLDLAINDGTEEQKKELKNIQQERIQMAITTYKPIVDQHTESGFTEAFVNRVLEQISDGDAIVDWYNDNIDEKTPEQLFRTYAHKYSVDIQNKLEKMNPEDLNHFSEEFYFKIVIMNVALSSKKLSEQYALEKNVEDRVPENKLENIILDEYKKSCQKKSGIHMPTNIRSTIKLYGDSEDENSRTGEIIEAVRDLWKLQDVNMTKDLLEAEKAKEDELNKRFSDKFTRLGDMAKARAEGAKEIYEKVLAVGKEYMYSLLYACVGLGALYVISKSKAPERVMDGGETKQNEETKQSEPQQPRPRAKTRIRLDDMVTNQDVYELKEKTPKQYYWITEDNQFIRISTKKAKTNENKPERYWKRLKSPQWKKPISEIRKFIKIGYIDGNGELKYYK